MNFDSQINILKENIKYLFQHTFWKPTYHLVEFYILNTPKWAGGYGGIPTLDICSSITGILFPPLCL